MRCTSQLSGTRQVMGADRVRLTTNWVVGTVALGLMATAAPAFAQVAPPPPAPTPTASSTNYDQSVGNGALNLGSNFLERLGNQASGGVNRAFRTNPGGGGASAATEDPRYRTWFEGYGISVRTDAQGDFVGDRRKTV
ncbi:autotransporter domain-containing protein, partial [Bradyrhizobium sp. PRIMUS42]|nr:autotransporter domain-containing protein [Bradyrhizobium sp. PRIMUS42]